MGPMKLILVISQLLSLTYAVENIACPSNVDSIDYDVHCVRNQTQENVSCYNDSFMMTWDYGDKDKGEIHFTIIGRMCKILNYELYLYRSNNSSINVDSHTAKEVMLNKSENIPGLKKLHSTRFIKEENYSNKTELPSCDQIRNITFTYVYTGCYFIRVENSYVSDPICITTNFMKESVLQQEITIFSQYVEDLAQVKHIVSNFSRLQIKKMELQVWRQSKKVTHCNDYNSGMIARQVIFLQPTSIACSSTITAMPCRLERENDRIECITPNVTGGYYCLLVRLRHDPCLHASSSVWDKREVYCDLSGRIEHGIMVKKPSVEYPITSGDSRVIILMVLLSLLFVAFIAALVFFLYRKWSQQIRRNSIYERARSPIEVLVDTQSLPVKPQIYLMYSRDCQPFMDVMKIFRSLLMEVLKCEVYDCFDSDSFEDMARIGVNWPGKLLANENVRVVLVETRCAKLHLQAHLEDFKIDYKDPTPWDDYFMYGLKAVMHNPKYNSYKKLFITRIQSFTSEEDKLKEINPYIRYDILDDFYNLLSSILQQFNLTVPYDWNYNINELQEAIKNLQNYEKINENYLDKFLIKRKMHGLKKLIAKVKH